MRRVLADIGAVLVDLLPIVALLVLAVTAVLLGGVLVNTTLGPVASVLLVNQGLAVVAMTLIGWLTIRGRHRYERRPR